MLNFVAALQGGNGVIRGHLCRQWATFDYLAGRIWPVLKRFLHHCFMKQDYDNLLYLNKIYSHSAGIFHNNMSFGPQVKSE